MTANIKQLENQQIKDSLQKQRSENGGSTNLSQGSNQVDDQFKVKKDQKYEFINQNVKEWPQWSVDQKEKSAAQTPEQVKEVEQQIERIKQIQNDYSFMFNRGMSYPVGMKFLQQRNKIQSQRSLGRKIVDKVKGWLKF